jgi:hypothetical protein
MVMKIIIVGKYLFLLWDSVGEAELLKLKTN